jgi:hypothetical protein
VRGLLLVVGVVLVHEDRRIPFAERITQFGEGDGTAQLLQRDLVVDKALAAGMGGGWERRRDGEC